MSFFISIDSGKSSNCGPKACSKQIILLAIFHHSHVDPPPALVLCFLCGPQGFLQWPTVTSTLAQHAALPRFQLDGRYAAAAKARERDNRPDTNVIIIIKMSGLGRLPFEMAGLCL